MGGAACGRERLRDAGGVGTAGDEQVGLGAGETVGLVMDWAGAGPGGQDDWHARGELGQRGHRISGHVAGAEGGQDQAVHVPADRVDEHTIIA
jgi:hypothetical protein